MMHGEVVGSKPVHRGSQALSRFYTIELLLQKTYGTRAVPVSQRLYAGPNKTKFCVQLLTLSHVVPPRTHSVCPADIVTSPKGQSVQGGMPSKLKVSGWHSPAGTWGIDHLKQHYRLIKAEFVLSKRALIWRLLIIIWLGVPPFFGGDDPASCKDKRQEPVAAFYGRENEP